jgi:hypothetical protein
LGVAQRGDPEQPEVIDRQVQQGPGRMNRGRL